MTKEDVIRMAREAGFQEWNNVSTGVSGLFPCLAGQDVSVELWRFAALVSAAEREACAKVCEKEAVQIVVDGLEERAYNNAVSDCASAIRARNNQ